MSGVGALRYLLTHDAAAVTSAVPAANIRAGVIPLRTALPAIGLTEVGSSRRNTIAMSSAQVLVTERVQVAVQAKTYQAVKGILALVMVACEHRRAVIDGVQVDSILPAERGPDFEDVEPIIYTQSQDFIVRWIE